MTTQKVKFLERELSYFRLRLKMAQNDLQAAQLRVHQWQGLITLAERHLSEEK